VPRAGLSKADVIAAGAVLADEIGFAALAMAPLAQRLGVRPPSLYKHVVNLAELQHAIATLAMTELDRDVRDAVQGRSGCAALAAFAGALRDYVLAHPGRYAATVVEKTTGPEDPLRIAAGRLMDALSAVLRGYRIGEDEMVHALRTLRCAFHGFALLQLERGFQQSADPNAGFAWMVACLDRGLAALSPPTARPALLPA
jgi:AcrR family transcriptional regulator